MARTSLCTGRELDESDDAVTKLLQISALSLLPLFFAACDPEMVMVDDVQELELQDVMLDLQDSDGDVVDGGFEIVDDFSDAEFVPAPMVEYDLADEAEDEDEDEDKDKDPSADLPLGDGDGDDNGRGDLDLTDDDDANGEGSLFESSDELRVAQGDEEDDDIDDLAGF